MDIFVLRCGDGPVPIALTTQPATAVGTVPVASELDELWPLIDAAERPRLVVLGGDSGLAAVLTALMRTERLGLEIGYVPFERTPASKIYRTGTGAVAAGNALHGKPAELPLIRDDAGVAIVGRAVVSGRAGAELEGEAYVDDTRLFSGTIAAVHVEPTLEMPGLRAYSDSGRRLSRKRWVSGRAMQLGTVEAVLQRDGIPDSRRVKRTAFYRHHEPWKLVQPR
ncbi:hypothetical protein [Antrihabitans stalactiti]|uniref:DAGKc domain-containing protein n=1 Tax=Antrihabitans stalactiti TaxID=2584121 RepID=A0A848KJX0_9NOCA|nr:hypothetical protein [Antrihabitans stalactiti]NMN98148.1 hypothetical protein [Antrihabitans stalactiti]